MPPSRLAFGLIVITAGVAAAPPARAEPEVRILLREAQAAVEVRGADLTLVLDDGPSAGVRGPVTVEARGGEVHVAGRRGGRGVLTARGPVELDGRPYLGRLEIVATAAGLTVVNRLPVETYLLGIVGSEMPAEWPVEALKAQAVAARTYALQRRLRRRAGGYAWDLEDSVLSQVYKGAESIRPSVIEAVRGTRGVVLTFAHEPAEALFHSTCGGHTVSAESVFGGRVPYLEGRPCRWCRDSPRHRWEVHLDHREVARLLERAGLARGLKRLVRDDEESALMLRDAGGRRAVSATRVRAAVGYGRLFSTRFSVLDDGRSVTLQGAGFGHRVGLCQWGARGMAEAGRDFEAILQHYYRGSSLKRAY